MSVEMLERLAQHWEEGRFCDVTLQTEEETGQIHAHKIILASFSEYFAAMFNPDSKMAEGQMECVTLKEMPFDILQQVVRYAYTCDASINSQNAAELFKIADFLQVQSLCDKCSSFMADNLSPENCFEILEFSDNYHCVDLKTAAIVFGQVKFGEVCKNDTVKCLNPKVLSEFLSSDRLLIADRDLRRKGEMAVLNMVLTYLKGKENLSSEDHVEILSKVRLPWLPVEELDQLLQEEVILGHSECVTLVNSAKEQSQTRSDSPKYPHWATPRKFAEIGYKNWKSYASGNYVRNEMHRFKDLEWPKKYGALTGMKIWIRRWDGRPVIGGIEVYYGEVTTGIHGHDRGELCEFRLNPRERIVKATVRSGWLVDALTFKTSTGRQLGPYGGDGGGEYTEDPIADGFDQETTSLGYIAGTVVDTQGEPAITKLRLFWAYERDPDDSDHDDSDASSDSQRSSISSSDAMTDDDEDEDDVY